MSQALLISYHFPPENLPATLHPRFFAKYLPRFGVDVDVVTTSYSPLGYDNPGADPGIRVRRVPLDPSARDWMKTQHRWESFLNWHLKRPDWGRSWIRHGAAAAMELAGKQRYDAMISFSPCFATHRAALPVKRRYPDLPWLAYLADPFVGNPMTPANPVQRLIDERLEAAVFGAANRVIGNTAAVERLWRDRYPRYSNKFSHIPNGFDLEEPVGPLALPSDRAARVLLHTGALYGGRFPNLLLASIHRLSLAGRLKPPDLQVRLLGAIDPAQAEKSPAFRSLRERGFVAIDEPVSRPEAIQRAAEADYLLLLDLNDSNSRLQVPSKLFDYLRIGRPILCYTPAGSETQRILQRAGVPNVVISAEDGPEEADRQLLGFLKLPTEPEPMSEWAKMRFDAYEMTRKLISLFGEGAKASKPRAKAESTHPA
jgi:glycosyltransferase involved in cell wall biosynthesis